MSLKGTVTEISLYFVTKKKKTAQMFDKLGRTLM